MKLLYSTAHMCRHFLKQSLVLTQVTNCVSDPDVVFTVYPLTVKGDDVIKVNYVVRQDVFLANVTIIGVSLQYSGITHPTNGGNLFADMITPIILTPFQRISTAPRSNLCLALFPVRFIISLRTLTITFIVDMFALRSIGMPESIFTRVRTQTFSFLWIRALMVSFTRFVLAKLAHRRTPMLPLCCGIKIFEWFFNSARAADLRGDRQRRQNEFTGSLVPIPLVQAHSTCGAECIVSILPESIKGLLEIANGTILKIRGVVSVVHCGHSYSLQSGCSLEAASAEYACGLDSLGYHYTTLAPEQQIFSQFGRIVRAIDTPRPRPIAQELWTGGVA